jgi:general secretion pathway protein G
MNTQFIRQARKAFTLIELLLVMVILVVLAAVVVPKFAGRSEQARIAAATTDVSAIDQAMEIFEQDAGRYPSNEEGLSSLVQQPGNVRAWHGPYIKKGIPIDPWGNAYVYRYPGTQNQGGFDLYSMGPDGREGNDDITNWTTNAPAAK